MSQEDLIADCARIAQSSRDMLGWINDLENRDLVGLEHKSLVKMVRKTVRRASKLERAAASNMAVSVFGPSQAGKSFLVSVLARPEGGRLVADFDDPDGALDYIREINPEGEGESTGVVTRFTIAKDPTPKGFPIRLTLLSEADIARTIINSFYMDGDQSEVPLEATQLSVHLDLFKGKARQAMPGLDLDDVYEIADYVDATFGRSAYAAALRSFWDEAAIIAPDLDTADRAEFLSILWGGHKALSNLYLELAQSLAELSHAEEVFVGLDALVPRETSIIDVKTLRKGDEESSLSLQTPAGAVVNMDRSRVCALAAELVIPMRDQPSELFAFTDLLDFPGARNRFEQPLAKTLEDVDNALPELLLRGKVAYLFDRYVANQEITSMLLCIPDSNMETLDLPTLVENWISATHGSTPILREQSDCGLFFVLTKFDKHLGDSAAEGGDSTRFERRMQASLIEKFGRSRDSWVGEWHANKPFQNCFWLRNPNYYVDGLLEYDSDKHETGIRDEKRARVSELRDGCLEAPSVQRHFSDPAAAWDAALSLNDGGVQYLTEQLGAVCKPDSKLNQIKAQLSNVSASLRKAMTPFHVSDDIENRVAEKQESASAVIDDLEDVLSRKRFGAMLSALMVDQEVVQNRVSRVPSSVRIDNAMSAAGGSAAAARPTTANIQRPGRPMRPASVQVEASQSREINSAGDVRTMSLEEFQAETAIETWIEALKVFRDATGQRKAHGLGDTAASELTAELIHAVRRIGLSRDIAKGLTGISFGLDVEKQAGPASILSAETINGFVSTLGMNTVALEKRPQVQAADGTMRPVFAPRQPVDRIDTLPEHPRPAAEELWSDWVFALEALFIENAKDGSNGVTNVEQNLKLGRILSGLTA
ncbi:MAG: virulence factor SrfC family protein [Paracoccaceae bacterium]